MNIEQTRFNMVAQQIRTWNVLDDNVLDLLYKIKREEFVSRKIAQWLLWIWKFRWSWPGDAHPKMEARILQELHVKKTDKILEVGSGSGYMTHYWLKEGACLQCRNHIRTESHGGKQSQSAQHHNVTIEQGDAARGWPKHGPYDVIVLTASTPVLPDSFQNSLNPGGRLFAIVGEDRSWKRY